MDEVATVPGCKLHVRRTRIERARFPFLECHGHFADCYGPVHSGSAWRKADPERVAAALQERGAVRAVNLDGFWDGFLGFSLTEILRTFDRPDGFYATFVSVDTSRADEPGFESYVRDHLRHAKDLGARGVKMFKHVSLMVRGSDGGYRPGRGIRIDDPRLDVIWQTAAELDFPVLAHVADPEAFFDPVDGRNERREELLRHPDWSYHGTGTYSFAELMQAQRNLLRRNPRTRFVLAHVGSNAENLGFVAECLDAHPNLSVDIAARADELGRQPYGARRFLDRYRDRVLFGTDVFPDTAASIYEPYFRLLETDDECIEGGFWPMYGLSLDDGALQAIYRGNAERWLFP